MQTKSHIQLREYITQNMARAEGLLRLLRSDCRDKDIVLQAVSESVATIVGHTCWYNDTHGYDLAGDGHHLIQRIRIAARNTICEADLLLIEAGLHNLCNKAVRQWRAL